MIEKLATDYDHNYIKENQFQEKLFLLLKFLNLYYTCLKAYVHESFYYLLEMLGDRIAPRSDRLFGHNVNWYPLNKQGWTTCSGTILRHLRIVMEGFTPDY
ncbi:MAG: hypothetical protein HEQ26_12985 [Dolichospermum sp. DL01]|nr:MAG: hypothetical protein HEQ26_12985 [Dolichospermum sp. DL01]